LEHLQAAYVAPPKNPSCIKEWVKEWIPITQAFITIAAVLVGGWWTYKVFIEQREQYPNANIDQKLSHTLPQVMETFGTWAAYNAIKQCYTMASDYGPGHDAEAAFQRAFKKGGGEIVGSVRFPVANPDFSAFVQRAKDLNPQCIYIFVPGGAQPAALGKALAERGIDLNKTKVLGSGETTSEQAL
jgi:hypothetical protein